MHRISWNPMYATARSVAAHRELDPLDCATATLSAAGQLHPGDMTIDNILDGVAADRRFHWAAYTDVEDERHF